METIDWNKEENQRTFLAWAIIELMTDASTGKGWENTFQDVDITKMQIECKINGVEVSFRKLNETLEKQYEKQVNQAAEKLVMEKFGGLQEAIHDAEHKIRDVLDTHRR